MTKTKGFGIHVCTRREPTFWETIVENGSPLKTLIFAFILLSILSFIATL